MTLKHHVVTAWLHYVYHDIGNISVLHNDDTDDIVKFRAACRLVEGHHATTRDLAHAKQDNEASQGQGAKMRVQPYFPVVVTVSRSAIPHLSVLQTRYTKTRLHISRYMVYSVYCKV